MSDPRYSWDLTLGCGRDRHRYFMDWKSGRIGIADASGKVPDETDDGVLWLDRSRPIRIADGRFWIPIVHPDGTKISVIADAEETRYVSERFKLPVDVFGVEGESPTPRAGADGVFEWRRADLREVAGWMTRHGCAPRPTRLPDVFTLPPDSVNPTLTVCLDGSIVAAESRWEVGPYLASGQGHAINAKEPVFWIGEPKNKGEGC